MNRGVFCGYVQGNTHLFWNPQRPDIKAIQAHTAIAAVKAFCRQFTEVLLRVNF
jgi:mRNA deadenylase 3'-5' endonuclease subunit Ccr4